MSSCSICNRQINAEEPPILTVGAYGVPRYLCEECAADIDAMTGSHELDGIAAAFDRIGEKIASNPHSDGTVNRVMTEIMENARGRAERIKDGTYDFSEDERDDGVPDEIPEELLESEEDREAEEEENERNAKIDKVFNIVLAVAFVAALVYGIVKFLL